MRDIASKQPRGLAFLRTAIVTVPAILLLGFVSARLAPGGSGNSWYAALAKPPENPPDWVFPVAWSALYVLLGLALAMVIQARGSRWRGAAIALFSVQMAVNLIWSPLFFGLHQVRWALVAIVVMLVLAVATTLAFGRVRAVAAWLLAPYLLWLAFAGLLTYRIAALNPGAETLVPSSSTSQINSI